MVPPFFISTAALLLVLVLQQLFRLTDIIVSKGATIASTVTVIIYVLPGFLVITIPMALVVAALTAFSQMSADSEVTAMKASRISVYRMIRPVFFFAVLAFLLTAFTSLYLVPLSNVALKSYLFNMIKSRAMVGLEPGVFSSTFDGMVIYVDKLDERNNMEGVFISDERSVKDPYIIAAKRGKLTADPEALSVTLALQDGSIHTQPRDDESYTLMGFNTARIYLDIRNSLASQGDWGKNYEDMSTGELIKYIRQARSEGKPVYLQETELHKRLSIPFACLIFGLIGAPLGIRQTRSGKSAGIAIALFVFLVYYIVLATATNLAHTGTVPALRAYWIPNGLLVAAACLFVYKRGHEVDFMIGNMFSGLYYRAKARIVQAFKRRKF